jgi:hypothetical protein
MQSSSSGGASVGVGVGDAFEEANIGTLVEIGSGVGLTTGVGGGATHATAINKITTHVRNTKLDLSILSFGENIFNQIIS